MILETSPGEIYAEKHKHTLDFLRQHLTLSVQVSYQQPTSPYKTHTKYDIW